MSLALTADITVVSATLGPAGRGTVRFRSPHAGRCHQLYVNGRLAAWTDCPADRLFALGAGRCVRECTIVAVAQRDRATDLSDELGLVAPGWVLRRGLTRRPDWPRNARLQLLGDDASGTFADGPLASVECWPAWAPRWAWGEDRFGRGAFGWDGAAAPGLGQGAFAAGLFGFDERIVLLRAALATPGTHRVRTRLVQPDGSQADGPVETVAVQPPPLPPAGLALAGYDPATRRITLNVQGVTP
jgi:hypothetical protein